MIEVKELNFTEDNEDFVTKEELKKFVSDPGFIKTPFKIYNLNNTPLEGYYVASGFYFCDKYVTWFDIIYSEGWTLLNVYWKKDHKVMVFIRKD